MVYIRWQPSTSLQNFIHLHQSAAELLLFVQKSKMAAAVLNYNLVMLDHSRSPFMRLKFPFKFRADRIRTFRDIAIKSKILQIWLKMPIQSHKNHVFGGVLTPNITFLSSKPPKGPTLRGNTRFEP